MIKQDRKLRELSIDLYKLFTEIREDHNDMHSDIEALIVFGSCNRNQLTKFQNIKDKMRDILDLDQVSEIISQISKFTSIVEDDPKEYFTFIHRNDFEEMRRLETYKLEKISKLIQKELEQKDDLLLEVMKGLSSLAVMSFFDKMREELGDLYPSNYADVIKLFKNSTNYYLNQNFTLYLI